MNCYQLDKEHTPNICPRNLASFGCEPANRIIHTTLTLVETDLTLKRQLLAVLSDCRTLGFLNSELALNFSTVLLNIGKCRFKSEMRTRALAMSKARNLSIVSNAGSKNLQIH